MIVDKQEIPEAVQRAAVKAMKGEYIAADIAAAIEKAVARLKSAPDSLVKISGRIADRVMQRERRAGNIVFSRGKWRVVEKADA